MKQPTRSIIVMCAAALAGGTGGAVIATEAAGTGGGTQTVTRTAQATVNRTVAATSGGALSASAIYARSKDSVAYITATSSGSSGATATGRGSVDPYGGGTTPYGGGDGQGQGSTGGTATGSGFVISADGYVVTNAHVIDGASRVTAKIGDGKALTAKVVGVDQSTDLALLKVSTGAALKPLTLADSSAVQVGDATFAIGNPYGLDRTLTTGVVSALHRSIQSPDGYAINGVLQTDAALNPGNSGGPLLDAQGHVVGVNSQIATSSSDGESGGNTGVGFAVPSDTVTRVVQQLRASGRATHAYLGVGTTDDASGGGGNGAAIASVTASGPAADAGLRAGDVITKVGATAVDDAEAMGTAVDAHRPGEAVEVTYTRDGRTRTAKVTLGTRPAGTTQDAATTAP